MDLFNSQHSDAVAIFGETSPVVAKHLPTIKDELPKATQLESQLHELKGVPMSEPLGQIDVDVQLRAPRSGFRGPIARPVVSVLIDQRLDDPHQSCTCRGTFQWDSCAVPRRFRARAQHLCPFDDFASRRVA